MVITMAATAAVLVHEAVRVVSAAATAAASVSEMAVAVALA
jgi:hypothetical protein